MMTNLVLGAGFHASGTRPVDASAYERYIGRWSRMFVPALLASAEVTEGDLVLDVATGTGEAAVLAQGLVGQSGFIVASDISPPMLATASSRMAPGLFGAVVADGEALPFRDGAFGAVFCHLGLMFFHSPERGLAEFRRVVRPERRVAACVISNAERAPMWGFLAEALSQELPAERSTLFLSFSLAEEARLRQLMLDVGFLDVHILRERREGFVASFEEYWDAVEQGVGMMPQAYRALPATAQRSVRASVRRRLSGFKSGNGYQLSVEMLVASGRR